MKESKGFLAAVGAAAAALLAVWLLLVRPVRGEVAREAANTQLKSQERGRFFPDKGEPIGEVEKALEEEAGTLRKLRDDLGRLELSLPAELGAGDGRNTLYFQQQLAKLRARAAGSGIRFDDKAAPLGFSQQPQDEQVGEFLARLEVASRFLEAAKAARLAGVIRAEQPAPGDGPTGGGRRAQELPMRVVAAADEKSLILLLHALTQPESFLALKALAIEVKDASAGHFEAAMEFAGVTVVEDEGPVPGAPGAPDGDAETTGPKLRFRRGLR